MGNLALGLHAVLPEFYLGVMALFLLMVTAFSCRRVDNAMLDGTLAALLGTAWFLLPRLSETPLVVFNGMLATNAFTATSQLLVLAAAALAVIIAAGWLKEEGGRPSEFLVLLLLSTLGMLLMVSANDLLTLYLALETSSLALYVLASFARDDAKSSEAGLKYFTLGALASGMMLFGMSLVYGFAGTTGFDQLVQLFAANPMASKGVIVGVVLIIIGFCFKISAVPFHMWTPDVYEGAPTPVAAFFATAPKIAAFALFLRVMLYPFGGLEIQWQQVIIFVAIASMVTGALAAIMQTNIKRLLAYSSIGHAGFMLMGLAADNADGVQAVLIYLAIYIFMSAGAFGCVLAMRREGKYVEEIKELSGLAQTHPLLAFVFAGFMFSMAGIPPLAGFFGKMYVVLAAVETHLAWLAVIGVTASVIGGFYYIKIVKVMYFDEPLISFDPIESRWLTTGIALAAIVTLMFFLFPTPLVVQARIAAEALLHP